VLCPVRLVGVELLSGCGASTARVRQAMAGPTLEWLAWQEGGPWVRPWRRTLAVDREHSSLYGRKSHRRTPAVGAGESVVGIGDKGSWQVGHGRGSRGVPVGQL
jgi:hypothetical protein